MTPATSYTFSNVTAAHTIAASFAVIPPVTYTLTASAGSGGTITPSGTLSVNSGSSQTFTITPNSGYNVSQLLIDGTSVTPATSYTFSNVTAAHTIAASFAVIPPVTYTLTASAGANGAISPSGAVSVNSGANQIFTITPNSGYRVSQLLVDGTAVTPATSYTFSNVTAAHTIAASFTVITYTFTASAGTNGTISPAGSVSVNSGANQTFTITPNSGYLVSQLLIDGTAVTPATSYTFSNVTAAHTIAASFAVIPPVTYTLTASAGANGTISPTGSVSVNSGASQTFTITPNSGYRVSQLLIDGTAVTPATSYTFSNVTAAHTIAASFTVITYTFTASAGVNGSISPSGSVSINSGANQTFTITPYSGYTISQLLIDGTAVTPATSYTFSNVTAAHTITASFSPISFTISAGANAGGSISPSGTVAVNYNGSQTFTISPNTGYALSQVLVDGNAITPVPNSYTFSSVGTNHTISAYFSPLTTYTLTASANGGGAISPAGTMSVYAGASQTYTITPNIGNSLSQLLIDGVSVSPVSTTYTFNNISTNHTISATFVQSFVVSVSSGTGGVITPSTVSVFKAANQTFTITPNTGFVVSQVMVDNKAVVLASGNTYTLTNVLAAHTISASFNPVVTAGVAGQGGSISPSGTVIVPMGTNKTFTFIPNTGYALKQILVNGSSIPLPTSQAPANNTYTFSGVIAPQSIVVSFAIKTFTITASAGVGGNITPAGGATVNYGASQVFNLTPNTGYAVGSLSLDGSAVSLNNGAYTLTNVTAVHTLVASFKPTITASVGTGGTITPSGTLNVLMGANQTYTIKANTGYAISQVLVNGSPVSLTAAGTYTLTNVTIPQTIAASFAIKTFALSASAGVGGSISPASSTVNYGGSQVFTVTANSGYTVNSLLLDGRAVTLTNGSYTLSNVTAVHTLVASFKPTITASAGTGGTITPTGTLSVLMGANQTYTIKANTGYNISQVLVNGSPVSLTAAGTYTLTNVTTPQTIAASFAIKTFALSASAGVGGSISPASSTVNYGGSQVYTVTTNSGYIVNSILLDGKAVTLTNGSYTLSNITAVHTLSVSFKAVIMASAGVGGTITPSGTVNLVLGSNQTFTIKANAGYNLTQVLVDGIALASLPTSYTFTNVQVGHSIAASFTKK